jgi:multicomponent Na+:H+ antiporter subunit B
MRVRTTAFLASAGILGALLLWALAGLPDFGHFHGAVGTLVDPDAVQERHVSNVIAAVTFDYRGIDTMGEEMILFGAAMGVALILRVIRDEGGADTDDRASSDTTRLVGQLLVPVVLLLGLWLAAFGYVTPGGGFQGGVVLASSLVLLWASAGYRAYRRVSPKALLDAGEGAGAGGFVLLGLLALALDGIFLENLIGGGTPGQLLSAGSIPLLNWLSALGVAAANVLIFHEFFEEDVARQRGER